MPSGTLYGNGVSAASITGYAGSNYWSVLDYAYSIYDTYVEISVAGHVGFYEYTGHSNSGIAVYIGEYSNGYWGDISLGGAATGTTGVLCSKTVTYNRGTSDYNVSISINSYVGTSATSYTSGYITIPALASYSITYAANGGSSTPSKQTKYYGNGIYLAGAISRASTNTNGYVVSFNTDGIGTTPSKLTQVVTTSYTFKNWSGSNGVSYNAGAYYSANASLTLTAQWNSTTTRKPITLPAIPSRTGYTIDGWYTVNGLKIGNAGDSWVPTSTITLYAKWTARTFTISLNNNGAVTTTNVQYDSTYNLPTPTRAGYKFLGWYTAAEGGTKIQNGTVIKILSNVTYYAHWEAMGATYVYSNGSFKQGLCYVYTSSGWKHALPYVYTNGTWKLTTF